MGFIDLVNEGGVDMDVVAIEQQMDILCLMTEGFSNREIAVRVYLSETTVKSHDQEIFRKLEVHNRLEAALRATRQGWV
jgi:DNA-binding NarL/FixJ family response regulator